jgi:glutamate-ammonia-ligase adenylyltransferase
MSHSAPAFPVVQLAEPPASLVAATAHNLDRVKKALEAVGIDLDAPAALRSTLSRVCLCSEYVSACLTRQPALLADLLQSGDLVSAYDPGALERKIDSATADTGTDERVMMHRLREFRRREMLRIAWRDLAGWAPTGETLADLTRLAEACIQAAVDFQSRRLQERYGVPRRRDGMAQDLTVLGMGKLGGGELNFSSDIDLILVFPEEGETDGPRSIANSQFFIRLGQGLIKLLGETTADGFVFRVDLRLRPWGDAGPLAIAFDAMENYYQLHGREWERYALIKARAVAGDRASGVELLRTLRPFVYRRYLDYSAFASLREMKALLAEQVKRKGLQENIKLGPGGIREIEFVGQVFQLLRGGREAALRERSILRVLERLSANGSLSSQAVHDLVYAYDFLRRTENRLQMFADQQTHSLPSDELGRERLSYAMGYGDWQSFRAVLDMHMRAVHAQFNEIFSVSGAEQEEEASVEDPLWRLWHQLDGRENTLQHLAAAGFEPADEALEKLLKLRASSSCRLLSHSGRERLDKLVPQLVAAAGMMENSNETLDRLLHLLETIARRTVYLSLLLESPDALEQLVRLCAASPWIANLLTRHPILLDELIDPRTLYAPPPRAVLEADLRERLANVEAGDVELQMDVLRQYKQAAVLRVAAADITGHLPLMEVSNHLTEIAEIVLEAVLRLAEEHLAERHGRPRCVVDGKPTRPGFAIVAYGKLGGLELGYGSDLDIVFLHDSRGEHQMSDGERPLENHVYFARLGQRILHLLTTLTSAGVLYEVDMRLRPDGASGLIVIGVDALAQYQREKAWTWEHQALVRARAVAGSTALCEAFERLRREVLIQPRDPDALKVEVREMRAKMREHLGSGSKERFDLKQDPGGIADIEFMVQYCALAWAADYPELVRYSDNIRQLEALAGCGLLSEGSAELLADAYRAYRARVHRLALQEQKPIVPASEFEDCRAAVQRIWRELME